MLKVKQKKAKKEPPEIVAARINARATIIAAFIGGVFAVIVALIAKWG